MLRAGAGQGFAGAGGGVAAAGPATGGGGGMASSGAGGGEWSERFFLLSGHFLRYKKHSLNLTSVNLKQASG